MIEGGKPAGNEGDASIEGDKAEGPPNGVVFAEIERHLRAVHDLLCKANLVRVPSLASFNGWTDDGRPVRHRFQVEGYERTGPKVEQERKARQEQP